MAIQIREVEHNSKTRDPNAPLRPTLIKWKDQTIIRSHSLIETVKEILRALDSQDVVQINIIGDPSSGKTKLAKCIQHLIHKLSTIPISVRGFGKDDLLSFRDTLKTLQPANYALLFDDLSFLGAIANKRQIDMVKQAITEIRHLEGGQDVKIIIIKVFHYTKGLDKYLRQNDFTYFTSIGSEEEGNLEQIVGHKNMGKVRNFKKMRTQIKIAPEIHKKFSYQLGNKGIFTYQYRKPFQPELFWNGDTLRNIISPVREWIDPVCSICTQYGSMKKLESEIDVVKFLKEAENSYGVAKVKLAVKNILYQNGVNTHDNHVVACERFFKRALEKKEINLDDFANFYDLKPTHTKMRKPLDLILEKSKRETFVPEASKITKSNDNLEAEIKMEDVDYET